jgi:hypothetical protein
MAEVVSIQSEVLKLKQNGLNTWLFSVRIFRLILSKFSKYSFFKKEKIARI